MQFGEPWGDVGRHFSSLLPRLSRTRAGGVGACGTAGVSAGRGGGGRWGRGSGALRAYLPPLASLALLVWLLGPATSLAITLGPLAALVAWVAFYVHVLGGGRGPPVDNAAVARVLAAGGATHDAA